MLLPYRFEIRSSPANIIVRLRFHHFWKSETSGKAGGLNGEPLKGVGALR
jgi:hypothetical protein